MKVNVLPFMSKTVVPGGIITIEGDVAYGTNLVGKIQDEKGKNIISNSVVCGDILSFDYISRNIPSIEEANTLHYNNKSILNPLIVFAGFSPEKKLAYGVDLRHLKIIGADSIANYILTAIKNYYYTESFDDQGNQFYQKKDIGMNFFNLDICFMYKNFSNGMYAKVAPYLKKYYRSYNVLLMKNCYLLDIVRASIVYTQTVKVTPAALPG